MAWISFTRFEKYRSIWKWLDIYSSWVFWAAALRRHWCYWGGYSIFAWATNSVEHNHRWKPFGLLLHFSFLSHFLVLLHFVLILLRYFAFIAQPYKYTMASLMHVCLCACELRTANTVFNPQVHIFICEHSAETVKNVLKSRLLPRSGYGSHLHSAFCQEKMMNLLAVCAFIVTIDGLPLRQHIHENKMIARARNRQWLIVFPSLVNWLNGRHKFHNIQYTHMCWCVLIVWVEGM